MQQVHRRPLNDAFAQLLQPHALHVQVVMSAAPAGFTVEYSTPGNPAIVHAV